MRSSRGVIILITIAFSYIATLGNGVKAQTAGATSDSSGLEEVVVTAQKRSEKLQAVPLTVTAFNGDELTNHDIKSTADLESLVSGFTGPGDSGTSEPHLRGVGAGIISPGNQNSVSFYVDGVYYPTGIQSGQLSLADANDLEVLKGPQGTLFGRNATAGVIQIATRNPDPTTWQVNASLGYGNFNTISAQGYAGGPVTDKISTSFAISASHQGDGWGKDLQLNEDTGRYDQALYVHNKWIAQVSDDTEIQLNFDFERYFGLGMWDYHTNPFAPASQQPGGSAWNTNNFVRSRSINDDGGTSVRVSHDFGFALLTSISAYRQLTNDIPGLDSTGTSFPLVELISAESSHQFSEELQLTSELDDPLQWTLGAYYLNGYDEITGLVDVYGILPHGAPYPAVNLGSYQDTQSSSVFGQGSYAVTDDTRITLGLRLTLENLDANNLSGPSVRESSTKRVPTWRVAVDHQVNDDLLVYAFVSRGFKSGGFNTTGLATQGPFGPEYLTDFEGGFKSEIFDRKVRLNVSGFYYDYKGVQLTALVNGLENVYNAAAAEVAGVDVDLETRVSEHLKLTGGLESLYSAYTNFPSCLVYHPVPGGYASGAGSCKGNPLLYAPRLTFFLAPEYTLTTEAGDFVFTGSYSYNSGYATTPDNVLRQPAYGLLDASVKYVTNDGKYWARIWGKNLANEVTTGILSFSSAVPATEIGLINAPRTFGATVGVKF